MEQTYFQVSLGIWDSPWNLIFFGRILSTTLATLAGDAEESKGPVSTDLHLAARNGDLEKIDEMWLAAKLATCQFDGGIYQIHSWLAVWNIFHFSIQLVMSSSQTNSIIFQRGRSTTNQIQYMSIFRW